MQIYEENSDKYSSSPHFWEATFEVELAPFKRLCDRKAKQIIRWDDEVNLLMQDPIANEQKIKALRDKIKFINEDLQYSLNILNAIECLKTAYIKTTVSLLDNYKGKVKAYTTEIEGLKRDKRDLVIKYARLIEENCGLIGGRRTHGS